MCGWAFSSKPAPAAARSIIRARPAAVNGDPRSLTKTKGDAGLSRSSRRAAQLHNCLAQMSREHREFIDLFYYHEKSVEEVAEIIHISRNTVKTRMFYARKQLARLLSTHQDFSTHLVAPQAA
jgi:DNA-directed RNA polymerase specialized sigma24 family protein